MTDAICAFAGKNQSVLAKLLAAQSPPVSPRGRKSKTLKRKKSKKESEGKASKVKVKRPRGEEGQSARNSSSLVDWYQNWTVQGAAVEESDDENYGETLAKD